MRPWRWQWKWRTKANYFWKAFYSDMTTEILYLNRDEIRLSEMITLISKFDFFIMNFTIVLIGVHQWINIFNIFSSFFVVVSYCSWHRYIFDRKSPNVRHLGTGAVLVMFIIFFSFYFFCVKLNRIWLINSLVKALHAQWSIYPYMYILYMYPVWLSRRWH